MASRPTSPALFGRPFLFSSDESRRTSKQQDAGPRSRTSSLPPTSPVTAAHPDPFTAHPSGSSSFVTYDNEPPALVSSSLTSSASSTTSSSPNGGAHPTLASLPKRARGSLLFAASSLSFSRPSLKSKARPPSMSRKQSTGAAATPFMYSEVIEIAAAPPRDDEDAERERLRDAAAQSIGLDPVLLEERSFSLDEEAEDTELASASQHHEHTRAATPAASISPLSLALILPPFPATRASLEPFVTMTARVPKHYSPPSYSLLKLTFARQWKTRALLLTVAIHPPSPTQPHGTGHGPTACLHVFKNPNPTQDDRELERLPIGADSHVFVAEDDVAGRRGVVKVGSAGGEQMVLHMVDVVEAQAWIAAVKQAVLSQRSVRAGLGVVSPSSSAVEPRGDLDVMLSMRAQGMLTSPSPTSSSFPPEVDSSNASQRSVSVSRSPSGPVSALRGLFTGAGTRPRSPSTVSTTNPRSSDDTDDAEDSFGRAGTNLLSMLRSNSITGERSASPATPTTSGFSRTPPLTSSTPSTPRQTDVPLLDRKILQDDQIAIVEAQSHSNPPIFANGMDVGTLFRGKHASATLRASAGSPSLNPPPRRRAWTSSGGAPAGPRARPESAYTYTHANGSTADSFGLRQTNSSVIGGGVGSMFLNATPPGASEGGRPRTSFSSMSSYASGEPRTSAEIGRSNSKRWSRQSTLAQRLTPPDSALPEVPNSPPGSPGSGSSFRSSMRHPYAAEGSSSPSAGAPTRPASVQGSPQSFMLNLRDYSKRASSSSARSVSSASTSHSRATNGNSIHGGGSSFLGHRPRSSHRTSMPPPQRPAPLSALPPTPPPASVDDTAFSTRPKTPNSAPPTKTSFRESFSLRPNRLSLSPPSLPPSTGLPPRPDETPTSSFGSTSISFRSHRRNSSTGNGAVSLTPIPASPTPLNSPYPPPSGPLPPTPEVQLLPPPTSRAASIKVRLRLKSAPAQPPQADIPPHPSPVPSTINPYSVPSTPIGEPIICVQNDPSFLFTAPSTPPPLSRSIIRAASPASSFEGVTSLSPPPRRGSRRVSTQQAGDDARDSAESRPPTSDAAGPEVDSRRLSITLSPPTSAVSLVHV
ncbi:hypothetical protein IEO21_07488 [Rhodonia placenta]|uniref:PH domain-containing protein n=1 Tax=Rhodonia placenta TaxID=104341 RepID=A0A8H7U057_9APHY|nr:hypothetical protein IEO21_07488 [Postia placenta]